jgi:hypothetical protein
MSDLEKLELIKKDENTVDLIELLRVIWQRRRIVYICPLATLLLGIIYLHVATYTYTGVLEVTPIQTSGANLTGKMGGLGNLASLAGVQLPTDQSGLQFRLYVEGVHSRFAADAMAKNLDLMKVIFKGEWDEQSKSWVKPSGPISAIMGIVKRIIGAPDYPWQPPGGARLQKYMDTAVIVTEEPKSPVVTITYDNVDPQFAVAFLGALSNAVDGQLRQKSLRRTAQNIAYLTHKLDTVTLAQQRDAIMQAWGDQEKAAMLANSTASFAMDSFGPPSVSNRPSSPQPTMVLGSALLGGILIGVVAAFMAPAGFLGSSNRSASGRSLWSRLVDRLRGLFGAATKVSERRPPTV